MQTSSFVWPDIPAAVNAATLAAILKARQTGTNLLVWKNGGMVEITPDEAEAMMNEDEGEDSSQ